MRKKCPLTEKIKLSINVFTLTCNSRGVDLQLVPDCLMKMLQSCESHPGILRRQMKKRKWRNTNATYSTGGSISITVWTQTVPLTHTARRLSKSGPLTRNLCHQWHIINLLKEMAFKESEPLSHNHFKLHQRNISCSRVSGPGRRDTRPCLF